MCVRVALCNRVLCVCSNAARRFQPHPSSITIHLSIRQVFNLALGIRCEIAVVVVVVIPSVQDIAFGDGGLDGSDDDDDQPLAMRAKQ